MHMHLCVSGGKKCLFFGTFSVFSFLVSPVSRFALLPYYQQAKHQPFYKLKDFVEIKTFIEFWSFESGYNAYVTWKLRSSWLWEKNLVYSSFSERKFWDCTCYSPISFLLLWATLSSAFTQQEFREGSLVGLGAKFRIGRFPV